MTTRAWTSRSSNTVTRVRESSRPKGLGANSILALMGDIASKLAMFVILVIAGQSMAPVEFARFGVCLAGLGVVAAVLDGGIAVLISRDGAASPARRRSLVLASIRVRVPLGIAALLLSLLAGAMLGRPIEWVAVCAAGLVAALTLTLSASYRAAQNLEFEARQRAAAALLAVALVGATLFVRPTASAAVLAFALAGAIALPMLVGALRSDPTRQGPVEPPSALRAALPLGAMAIATIIYFRAPTLLLGVFGNANATAAFTVASTIGFGLLAVPNAITTGLLPRLAATSDPAERMMVAHRALRWTLQSTIGLGVAAVALSPWVIQTIFGDQYRWAAGPLSVLLLAGVMIGVNGLLGTVLIASRRTRLLALQVGISLVVNLVAACVLIPLAGAWGAAVATLVAEAAALVVLAPTALRTMPGVLRPRGSRAPAALAGAVLLGGVAALLSGPLRIAAGVAALAGVLVSDARMLAVVGRVVGGLAQRVGALRGAVLGILGGLGGLAAYGVTTGYGLRVTSDTPSFLAIVHQLAAKPLKPLSPFLASESIEHSHATPYTQLLATIWDRTMASHTSDGTPIADPASVYRLLGVAGAVVTALLLHSLFLWVKSHAGSRAAWISLPIVLLTFGPAHVIWAGDLSFHAVLYGAYFPQTLAAATLLYTLVAVDGPHRAWRYPVGALGVATTLTVHPFTGAVLCLLLSFWASVRAFRRQPRWGVAGWSMLAGFALTFLWPAYSVDLALAETGLRGTVFIGACVLIPILSHAAPRAVLRIGSPLRRAARALDRPNVGRGLAALGVAGVIALIVVQVLELREHVETDVIRHHRLALYWGEDRWRWPFMLVGALVGLLGLARLVGRGRLIPAAWFAGAMSIGCAGALGLPIPVWWRFILFCQVPLALGVAVWLAESGTRWSRRLVAAGFGVVLVYRVGTLVLLPPAFSYLGTPLQQAYDLGRIVPVGPGLVASDPFTSYYVPGATGHKVLVVTKGHVNSRAELEASNRGYEVLREFAAGRKWWPAARDMHASGVRYIVIEKHTLLRAKTLEEFSTGPTPLVRDGDGAFMTRYFYRSGRVGELVHTDDSYAVYRLLASRLGVK